MEIPFSAGFFFFGRGGQKPPEAQNDIKVIFEELFSVLICMDVMDRDYLLIWDPILIDWYQNISGYVGEGGSIK